MNWVLDADIRGFFDHVNHEWMLKFLQHRMADHRILGLIQNMAEGGSVGARPMHGDESRHSAAGVGLTAALANVYLHLRV